MKGFNRDITIVILGTLLLLLVLAIKIPSRDTTEENGGAKEGNEVCIQVITPARNLLTGEVKDFPTPCDVPTGWEIIENEDTL